LFYRQLATIICREFLPSNLVSCTATSESLLSGYWKYRVNEVGGNGIENFGATTVTPPGRLVQKETAPMRIGAVVIIVL
jgi:hypothetical protein